MYRRWISTCLVVISFSGCDLVKENTLFKIVTDSGIHFNNIILENDSMNILALEYFYRGGGVAIGDLNNDQLPDVILGGNMVPTRLYLNQGSLKFKDITRTAGLLTDQWINGISLADLNHDGFLDIYMCSGGSNHPARRKNLLFISQGIDDQNLPHFAEKAAEMGVDSERSSTQSAWLDFDLDGDLDMILVNTDANNKNPNVIVPMLNDGTAPNADQFFENQLAETGRLTFKEVSKAAGIKYEGFSLGVAVSDFNYDGWPDLYIANDHISNDVLYINQQNKSFTNLTGKLLKTNSYYSMGVVTKDFSNDGLTDIFTLDMMPEVNERKQKMMMAMNLSRFQMAGDYQYQPQFMRNTLQLNLGFDQENLPVFSEIGQLAGIHNTDWSWGAVAADFDLDSNNDLIIANGYARDITNLDFVYYKRTMGYFAENLAGKDYQEAVNHQPPIELSNYAFANRGNATFEEVTQNWGLHSSNLSNGIAYGDLDLDGDLDLVVNHINQAASVYENQASLGDRHFLKIFPKEPSGSYCTGVKSYLYSGNEVMFQELFPVQGFQSAHEPVIHYGFKDILRLDSLVLIWPNGLKSVMVSPLMDSTYTLTRPGNYLMQGDQITVNARLNIPEDQSGLPIFEQHSLKEGWKHQPAAPYQDLYRQPLLHKTYSKEAPKIASADIDDNGFTDFYVCSGPEQEGTIYHQTSLGTFTKSNFDKGGAFSDMDAEWLDVDQDGLPDLFVSTGSVSFGEGNKNLRDRLYMNTGNGFELAWDRLPDLSTFTREVVAFDYDLDGDQDLLILGRVTHEKFPQSPLSYLLQNDQGRYKRVGQNLLPDHGYLGMVAAAEKVDIENDGRFEVILASEWHPLRLLRWHNDKFIWEQMPSVSDRKGWWQSIKVSDLNQDGFSDILVGNFGLNNVFAENLPICLYEADLDGDSFYNPLLAWKIPDQQGNQKFFPVAQKDQLTARIPYLKRVYQTYEEFAKVDMEQLLALGKKPPRQELKMNCLESFMLINRGGEHFDLEALPREAQSGPVNAFVVEDFDHDGYLDILGAGNNERLNVNLGWNNNSKGFLLKGSSSGYRSVSNTSCNLFLDNKIKDMAKVNKHQVVLSSYNDSLRILNWNSTDEEQIVSKYR